MYLNVHQGDSLGIYLIVVERKNDKKTETYVAPSLSFIVGTIILMCVVIIFIHKKSNNVRS